MENLSINGPITMRINIRNTLIEDNSYPLAGMREADVCKYFTDALRPYTFIIDQVQGALFLHNVPLFCTMLVGAFAFVYSLKIVNDSDFPTVLYYLALVPIINLLLKLGGANMLRSLCVDLPDLDESEPNRIRSIEEIVQIGWQPLLYGWRVLFFVYRLYLRPNIVDICVFLFVVGVFGLLCCVVDVLSVFAVCLLLCLLFPPLLTRKVVSNFLIRQLGTPLPDNGKMD